MQRSRRELLRGLASGAAVATVGAGTVSATSSNRKIIGTKTKQAAEIAKQRADTVHHELDFGDIGFAIVGEFPQTAAQNMASTAAVKYVEDDVKAEALGETLPWGIDRVDADVAHADGYTGSGADIAILDTGIDSDHPDLQEHIGTGKAYVYCGHNNDGTSCSHDNQCNEPWDDDHHHGTHCAGIAAAIADSSDVCGVSPDATLHSVRVLGCNGYGYYSDIAAGLEYVADQGWDVASMSLGGSSGSSTLQDACQYAQDNGVLVVAAAGNDGPCSDCVRYPAAYSSVVAVSATDSSDDLASFSSTGSEVDLAAPGQSILSTYNDGDTATLSGTSMACPHVSGAAGMLMATGYSNTEARERLCNEAEDIGLSGNEQGNGLLDAQAAVSSSNSDDSTSPSAPSNLSSLDHTDTSVDLTWDVSSDDETGVDHYNVYVDGAKYTESTDNSTTVSGLSRGKTYDFAVTSVDGAGNESGKSNSISVTTGSTTAVGEVGSVTTNQPDPSTWHSVAFDNSYSSPVVVMNPPSFQGGQPAHVRVRNVGSDGFEFRIEEWMYQDGAHYEETMSYLVMESGTHTLSTGHVVEAGTITADHDWATAQFSTGFGTAPIVFGQSQTFNGGQPIITRQQNVSSDSAELRVQEAEGMDGRHLDETVGYIAVEPGTANGLEVDATPLEVTDDWYSVSFASDFSDAPLFVARMQTSHGGQTGNERYRNLDPNGVDLCIQEEQSHDDEMVHWTESVGYFVIGNSGDLTAQ
jgi:subtilisin